MADLGTLTAWAFLAMLLNAGNLTALFFSVYFSMKTNTVAAWILFVASFVILQPLAYYCGLSVTWAIAFAIFDVFAFILLILASVRACNNTGSCCTTDGDCVGKKKSGCNMGSMCNCCECECCEEDNHHHKKKHCDHDDCPSDKCNYRKKKPTHNGGAKVNYNNH